MKVSQYALMAEAVDAMVDPEVLGAPKRTTRKRGSTAKKSTGAGPTHDQADVKTVASTVDRNESANDDDIDEGYRHVFAALSEKTFQEMMLTQDERLEQILEVLTKWWQWDKNQVRTLRAEARERQRREELENAARRQAMASGSPQSSNSPLTDLVGDMMGNGPDTGGRRSRKDSKTRRRPGTKRGVGGALKSTGSRAWQALRGGGKWAAAAALAGVGALGLTGARSVSEGIDLDVPEVEDKPKTTKTPTTAPQDVARETRPTITADGMDGPKKEGLFKRMSKAAGASKMNWLVGTALAAKDVYDISSDETLTEKEKDKAYSGAGGGLLGGVLGGMGAGALGAALGQVLIPIPGVGAAIGGALGSMAGGYLGNEVGSSAGEMVYDVVVREDQKPVEEDDNTIKVKFDSPELKKIADAAESEKNKPKSWWDGLFGGGGGGNPSVGSYARGTAGMSTPGTGYSTMRDNMVPRTAAVGKLDYTNSPGYVAGQGVLKDMPQNDIAERRLSNFSGIMEQAGEKNNVDPLLLRAVAWQESRGNAAATSRVGAAGLMQIMPGTAGDLGVTDRYDPQQSVNGGAKYLAQLTKRYNGNVPLALAAYNGGMGNIDKAIKKAGTSDPEAVLAQLPSITGRHSQETIDYVKKITAKHSEYREITSKVPKSQDVQSTVEVQRTQEGAGQSTSVEVPREIAVPQMLARTTVPEAPAPAAAQQTAQSKPNKPKVKAGTVSRAASPAAGIPTLDDMPLILTEQGLGNFLMGEV